MIEFLAQLGVPKQYAGDAWLLLIFLAASIVLVLLIKKRNLGAMLISVYVTYAVVSKSFFRILDEPSIKLAYFIIVLVVLFQLFRLFFKMGMGGSKAIMWTKVTLVSFSIIGLMGSIMIKWFSEEAVSEFFSLLSLQLFRSQQAQFVWMIIPLVLIFILVRRKT